MIFVTERTNTPHPGRKRFSNVGLDAHIYGCVSGDRFAERHEDKLLAGPDRRPGFENDSRRAAQMVVFAFRFLASKRIGNNRIWK